MATSKIYRGHVNYVRRQSLAEWDMGRDLEQGTIHMTCVRLGDISNSQLGFEVLPEEMAKKFGMVDFDVLLGAACASDEIVSSTPYTQEPETRVLRREERVSDLQSQTNALRMVLMGVLGMVLGLVITTRVGMRWAMD